MIRYSKFYIRYSPFRTKNDSGFTGPYSIFKGSGGFTLLEVLVSLALLGIAVTAILQLFSADLKAIAASENYVSGSLEAQSKMREVLDTKDLAEGRWSGVTDNGYRFEVSVQDALTERTETLQMKLVEVEVKVSWSQGRRDRSVTLKTMKTLKKPV